MRPHFCALALLLGLAAVLLGQETAPNLVLDAPAGKSLPRPAQIETDFPPGVLPVRSRLVAFDLDTIDPDRPGAQGRRRVRLSLFPDVDLDVEETRSRGRGRPQSFQWSGKPAGDPAADVVLSVVDGRVSGSISLKRGFFQIRHLQDDIHEITEFTSARYQTVDDAIPPPAAPPLGAVAQLAKPSGEPQAVAAGANPVVDILVVYTPQARAGLGGSQVIQDRILLAVAEANTSFVNSAASIEFNLVGMAEVAVPGTDAPTGSFLSDVTFSTPEIQALRDHYGADLVSVWVSQGAGNVVGIAWLNPGPPSDFSSTAYGVVRASAALGPVFTFTHEAGHNLGGAHDRANAGGSGAFSYSYGYQHPSSGGNGFYTIMSYSNGCSGCSAVNHWSNPNVLVNGSPSGIDQSQSNSADNALTLTQIAPSAAAFRATQSPAPNNPPVPNNQNLIVTSALATPITLTGSDPDGNPVFFDIITPPLHGTFTGSGASWTYTGNTGYSGPDSLQFQIRDGYGGYAFGTVSLTVQLPSSNPPVVSLAQPLGGPFTAPASINLVATATDPDGSVAQVVFFADSQQLGTATSATSTFTFNWTNVAAGTYNLTAVAHDNLGITTTSSPISVTVQPGGGGMGYTTRMGRLFYAFDEPSGPTVFDKIGTNHGTIGGAASRTTLGLKGGWADSGVSSFSGNKLSAASGDAYTAMWIGRLDTANGYQTLFSMADGGAPNMLLRYYQPNGFLYLFVNGGYTTFNAGSLLGKVVMITLRCSAGACSWRVGGSGPWLNAPVGAQVATTPKLQVGADFYRWAPHINNTSAMFWVYGDALSDQEVSANFQYAGSIVAGRGAALEGFVGGPSNIPPTVSLAAPAGGPFTAPASINLSATAGDADGAVSRVDFLVDGSVVGSDATGSPYTFTWSNVAAATYSVVARAVDNLGASTDSAPVSVTVAPGGGGGGGSGYTTRAAQLLYAFDEGAGPTVFDNIGSRHATVGGAASWTTLGLKGGYADAGSISFAGNTLSAASGNAFTAIWVGRLDTGGGYQTLFSMASGSASNILLRYYQPNGFLYLFVNGGYTTFNAGSLLGKTIMIGLRCSGGACSWRVGGSGAWLTAPVGTQVAASPKLQVGSDFYRWAPHVNNTSALFWVYNDSLTDPEIDANFQYAGGVVAARGASLDGYSGGPSNIPPTVSLAAPAGGPFTAPASINLSATAGDPDGSVSRVDFLVDGSVVGSDTTGSPYTFTWNNVAAATYSVVARAVDNLGATTDSAPVSVTVTPGGGGSGYTTRAAQLLYAFDEGGGSLVPDEIGANDASVGGAASWTTLGLKGGYADAGVVSFGGNNLSAASGNAFTAIWVGRLDTANGYQTLFSMANGSTSNVLLRYYQPNGFLYLFVNGGYTTMNAGGLLGKVVMITLRCSAGACSWRIGGAGAWANVAVGTAVAASPKLQVGTDFYRWAPHINNTSALFWVYNDALTDPEVSANFQYAGGVVAGRGAALDGYVP